MILTFTVVNARLLNKNESSMFVSSHLNNDPDSIQNTGYQYNSMNLQNHRLEQQKQSQTKTDLDYELFNSFLNGCQAFIELPQLRNCNDDLQYTINIFNQTFNQDKFLKQKSEIILFSVTQILSNSTANSINYCYSSGYQFITKTINKLNKFPTPADFWIAFLSTQMGNIIVYNSIYQNIKVYSKKNQQKELFYEVGRFYYSFTDIEPFLDGSFSDSNQNIQEVRLRDINSNQIKQQQSQHTIVELIILNSLAFLNSFLVQSFGVKNEDPVICTGNLTLFTNYLSDLAYELSGVQVSKFGLGISNLMRTFHPILYSCSQSAGNIFSDLRDYQYTITNPLSLISNLFHGSGDIYDNVLLIKSLFLTVPDLTSESFWTNLGGLLGATINSIFQRRETRQTALKFK